jgi:hypothetical protein
VAPKDEVFRVGVPKAGKARGGHAAAEKVMSGQCMRRRNGAARKGRLAPKHQPPF